jgi:hypothetical protein
VPVTDPDYGEQDTMHGPTGCFPGEGGARVHGVLLDDPGSCTLPGDGTTITLEDWKKQQNEADS